MNLGLKNEEIDWNKNYNIILSDSNGIMGPIFFFKQHDENLIFQNFLFLDHNFSKNDGELDAIFMRSNVSIFGLGMHLSVLPTGF